MRLHGQLSGRAVQDLHLTPLVFEIARLKMSEEDAALLLQKLELIHEYMNPQEQESGIGKQEQAE